MPSTPKTVGRSIGVFAVVQFFLWFFVGSFEFGALFLLAIAGGIINKQSLRCGVIAQFLSALYAVGYGSAAIMLWFPPEWFTIRSGVEISGGFRFLAIPVFTVLAAWALWNAVAINRFVKGRTMTQPEEGKADSVPESPAAEGV